MNKALHKGSIICMGKIKRLVLENPLTSRVSNLETRDPTDPILDTASLNAPVRSRG